MGFPSTAAATVHVKKFDFIVCLEKRTKKLIFVARWRAGPCVQLLTGYSTVGGHKGRAECVGIDSKNLNGAIKGFLTRLFSPGCYMKR